MSEHMNGETTRRVFVGVGAAVAAAAVVLPVLGGERRAKGAAAEDKWIATVKPEDLAAGAFRLYRKNGFVLSRVDDVVYAISTVCTHQQCDVQPGLDNATKGLLVCKCHGGRYDPVGKVVQGPPKLPLTLVGVRVNGDGVIEVNMAGKGDEGVKVK